MRINFLLPLISTVLVMPALACSLPGIMTSLARATRPAVESTITVEAPVMPNDQFILKLPDGSAVSLTVTSCEGMGEGGFLDLVATNGLGFSDAGRVEVQINGGNQGGGTYDNMYMSIILGTEDKPLFSGNNPAVHMSLAGDGSGSFKSVEIVNISNTAPYEYGKAYKFSGDWSCKR